MLNIIVSRILGHHLVAQTFFALETPVVLIVHRAGAAARLRPVVRCLERGEEINNQWPELRQQQQPHTAADLAVVSAQSSQHCLRY